MRFRLPVEPKQTASVIVEEVRPLEISNVTDEQIALLARERSISPLIEDALRSILAQKNAISGLESQESQLDDDGSGSENMKVLEG